MLVFLLTVDLIAESFNHLGKSTAESILFATSNPFIGFFIGLLITAIIQSSSTSTSMIVAVVSTGSITISDAVPMVMGANVGTTLTSTIVALGYITNKNEFRRALAAGTIHDFFNIMTVLILFPLEYYYGLLSNLSQIIAGLFVDSGTSNDQEIIGFKLFNIIPITEYIVDAIGNGLVSIVISFILLFVSLKMVSKHISKILISESKINIQKLIGNPLKSFSIGAGITALVQSSSITTSLVIPFVATKRILLKDAMPFILGANVGTTVTAFLAVLFKSNAAMSIAITHLLFNLIGVLAFLPFPLLRSFVIKLSSRFGALTFRYRLIGLTYILVTFFAVPFTLIYFNKSNTQILELTYLNDDNTKTVVISKSQIKKNSPFFNELQETEAGSIDDPIVHVSNHNNIIFFNSDFFIINDIGFCWDGETYQGKYKICIADILPSVDINDNISIDSVLVFNLNYYDSTQQHVAMHQYFIGTKDNVLVKSLEVDHWGNILTQKELVNINKKY